MKSYEDYENSISHNSPKVGPPQLAVPQEVGDSILAEWKAWEQKVTDFLRSHAHGTVYQIPRSKNGNAQITFIVRLYFCLCSLVNFFPSFVKCKATHTKLVFPHETTSRFGHRAQEDHESPRLTDTELLRLRRGLLRYELCCRLIGMPSFAAICNEDLYAAVSLPLSPEQHKFWYGNPFCRLLPMDEVEEIVCASVYVGELYCSLHGSLAEEFENSILEMNQDTVEVVLHKEMNTVEQWLSNSDLGCYSSSLHHGEVGNRLGLVFLDRVIRSTLADRRELMRGALHTFRGLHCGDFLQPHWLNFYRSRVLREGSSLELGP